MLQELKALPVQVLIESDWNLKHAMMDIDIAAISINRIRLEFKDIIRFNRCFRKCSINRIRLEFKDATKASETAAAASINRIRLEFKVQGYSQCFSNGKEY